MLTSTLTPSWRSISTFKNVIILFCLFFFSSMSSQTLPKKIIYENTIGGTGLDIVLKAVDDGQGNIYLACISNSPVGPVKTSTHHGGNDYWLVQISAATGQKTNEWSFGGSNNDMIRDAIVTTTGKILMFGFSNSPNDGNKTAANINGNDYWAVLFDPSTGMVDWDQAYGGLGEDLGTAVVEMPDGNFLFGGYSDTNSNTMKSSNSKGLTDYWLIKANASSGLPISGQEITIGGDKEDRLECLAMFSSGDVLFAGWSRSGFSGDKKQNAYNGSYDFWIGKLRNDLQKIKWERTIGGDQDDQLKTATTRNGTTPFLAGNSASGKTGNKSTASKGGKDAWIVKMSGSGLFQWDKSIGGPGDESILETDDHTGGGLIHVGNSTSSNAPPDIPDTNNGLADDLIVRTRSQGNIRKLFLLGGSGNDFMRTVVQMGNNNFIVAGHSNSNANPPWKTQNSYGSYDIHIARIRL